MCEIKHRKGVRKTVLRQFLDVFSGILDKNRRDKEETDYGAEREPAEKSRGV